MEVATSQESVNPKGLWLPSPMETRPVCAGEIPCQLRHQLIIKLGETTKSHLRYICLPMPMHTASHMGDHMVYIGFMR